MKQIELMVLAAIMEAPAHGYALAMRVGELTGGGVDVRPGNLYRVLERLEQRGWIEETNAAVPDADDERRRYFGLTAAGRRAADAELRMYANVLAHTRRMKERFADG